MMCHPEDLRLRPAAQADRQLLFDWRNDAAVRANSVNTNIISWEDHCAWLNEKFDRPDACRIFIAETNAHNPVGQIRFEREKSIAVISFSIDQRHRGQGWAVHLLRQGIGLIAQTWGDITGLRAIARASNIASCKAFEKAGFLIQKTSEYIEFYLGLSSTDR